MTEPVWIAEATILAVHDAQLAAHGGASGVRDLGLLQSALARPQHLVAYAEPTVPKLAAAYGFGIARNHPFVDGNKRTAFVAVELFLELNGIPEIRLGNAHRFVGRKRLQDRVVLVDRLGIAIAKCLDDKFAHKGEELQALVLLGGKDLIAKPGENR